MRRTGRKLLGVAVAFAMAIGAPASAAMSSGDLATEAPEPMEVTFNAVRIANVDDSDLPVSLRPASVEVIPGRVELLDSKDADHVAAAATSYGYTFGRKVKNGFGTTLYIVYERIEWTGTTINTHSCWGKSGLATYRSCSKWTGSSTFGASWIFSVGPWGWPQYDPWTSGRVYSNGAITITFTY